MFDLRLYPMYLLGFLGTGHCVGMCGPIVLALSSQDSRLHTQLLYHLGRTATYVFVGVLLGGIGSGFAELSGAADGPHLHRIAQLQVIWSLPAAILMCVFGLSRLGVVSEPSWMSFSSPQQIPGFEKIQRKSLLHHKSVGFFLLGLMLGFLPCGLSYAAFAVALPAGGMIEGGMLLLAFSLGTLPGLLLVGTAARRLAWRYQHLLELMAGLLMIGMGISLFAKFVSSLSL